MLMFIVNVMVGLVQLSTSKAYENPILGLKNSRRVLRKEVNYLVKEFECRKSADSYARANVARTGVLDTTKLHTYRYNEDLFKKVTTIPDGKNHGLIFILDWSGSMRKCSADTIKQLYNLIWFCKKTSIPFDVYAFTGEWNRPSYDYDTNHYSPAELVDHYEKEGRFALRRRALQTDEYFHQQSEC